MKKRLVDMGGFVISKRQKQLVNQTLTTTRLSYGPMTVKFEQMWAKLHNVKHALFCNSGTSALQVALHALKDEYRWKDGDEVIMPALTFVASMNIILHNNMKPVFVDVDPRYYNIEPDEIERKITKKTRAILVVHLLGQPAQMGRIMKIAKKYGLRVIEDSCETVGATFNTRSVGSFGDVSCFSTYASHLVVTGVGGFACTNNDALAVRIKGLYNHGRDGIYHSIDDNKKGTQIMKSRFNFTHSGYSYRCTEMESALGIGHLERFDRELAKRRELAELLKTVLLPLERKGFIQLPHTHRHATHSWMLFGIVITGSDRTRDQICEALEKKGIATRYMMPLLTQPIVKKLFGSHVEDEFIVTRWLDDNAFLVGIHPQLTKADIYYIAQVLGNELYGIDPLDYE